MISDYTSNPFGLPYVQQVYEKFTPELQWSQNFIVGIVLKGNFEIHYGNHTRRFNEHDIFFFLPFEAFSVITSQSETKVLFLCVDINFLKTMIPGFSNITLQKHHVGHDLKNKVYYRLCCDIATIIFNNLKTETCSKFRLLNAISNIMITIFENYGIRTEEKKQHDYATERIMDILDYINKNYTEKITVNDISSYLGIHPQYFSSFFTKHFHTGFIEYLTSFRINASLNRLVYSHESILNIALANGFSNHKTYAAAFRKIYHMSPTDYRKSHTILTEEFKRYIETDNSSEYSLFSYFCQFLQTDNHDDAKHTIRQSRTLNFEPQKLLPHAYIKHQEHFYTIGRASVCLRSDIQKQIIQAKSELRIDHFRIRDIFSDSLYIYYEADNREPLFNWQGLDTVFDFILSLGAKPFPEIGYMPEKLASKKQYAHLPYHPNISFPKSLKKWQNLIRSFLLHYIERYGMEEVSGWYFDFWTSPDLSLKMSYWNESMESFFDFYRATYEVFLEINPDLKLGTPNFSTISGFPWYEAFFRYCHKHKLSPAYISIHAYGCDTKKDPPPSGDFNDTDNNYFSITNQNQVYDFLTILHRIMDENGFGSREVIVSDYNLNYMPFDLIRDTCYMGPYLVHSAFQTVKQVKALCHWSLSDISEDCYPKGTLFWGGPGLLDYHGLKKASYNTLLLLSRMGEKILDQGDYFLLAKKRNTYQLFLYNLIEFDFFYSHMDQAALDNTHRYNIYSNNKDLFLNIIIRLPKGTYYLKKYEVNRNHGSAYDIWGQMGYPQTFSKDMEDYLRESSVPHMSYSVHNVDTALILDETVPAHGVMLLEIQAK